MLMNDKRGRIGLVALVCALTLFPRCGDLFAAASSQSGVEVLASRSDSLGVSILAIDVTDALEHHRRAEDWSMELTSLIGRMMSAAVAAGVMNRPFSIVAITVTGDGPAVPVQVEYSISARTFKTSVAQVQRGWTMPPEEKLLPQLLVGTGGTFSIRLGNQAPVSVPIISGGIGKELADAFDQYFDIPVAAITGEFFTTELVLGSGLVFLHLSKEATDIQVEDAERAVQEFGLLSPRIRRGDGPRQWLRFFTPAEPVVLLSEPPL